MADKIAPVLLGSRVCFDDRWQGRVSGLEIDEEWNVYNIGVSTGFLFASKTVRLPFTTVSESPDGSVRIAANSFQAFAREVPPVAAPARPLDAGIPISHPGAKFAGLVIGRGDKRAVEIIVSRGVAGLFRVPLSEVSFSGKTMTISVPPEQLVRYYTDAKITQEIHDLIAEDTVLPTDDKRSIKIDIEGGMATITGNTRVDHTKDYAEALIASARGVVSVDSELLDDFELEGALGHALDAAGAHEGKVYLRSNLGEVQIDGFVSSARASEDVQRTVARVPGVRNVINRLQVRPAAAARS